MWILKKESWIPYLWSPLRHWKALAEDLKIRWRDCGIPKFRKAARQSISLELNHNLVSSKKGKTKLFNWMSHEIEQVKKKDYTHGKKEEQTELKHSTWCHTKHRDHLTLKTSGNRLGAHKQKKKKSHLYIVQGQKKVRGASSLFVLHEWSLVFQEKSTKPEKLLFLSSLFRKSTIRRRRQRKQQRRQRRQQQQRCKQRQR